VILSKLCAVLAAVLACLAGTTARAAEFGANDDSGKDLAAEAGSYYATMAAIGLRTNVITLHWEPWVEEQLPDRAKIDAALEHAAAAGVRVTFALYPARATAFTQEGATPAAFAAWAAEVARTYPQAKRFIIGNEPNQPRFWRPQFDAKGRQVSAAAFGPVLARTYDALKKVNRAIVVVGVGLSPRGNDRPGARTNVSTSPVRFLKALGEWYRRSHRRRPLMDALSFHPYPNSNRDGLLRGYPWPNAGVANLGRIKQAVWDAFHGTAQPTTLDGLDLYLDEVGWQVDTKSRSSYRGKENVAVTNEARQATTYAALVRLLGCDPAVVTVNFFGFRDEPKRAGWQAGLMRYDGTLRPAARAVRLALQETGGGCLGRTVSWHPVRSVIGAEVDFGRRLAPLPAGPLTLHVTPTAREEVVYRAAVFRADTASSRIVRQLSARRPAVTAATGVLRANRRPPLSLPTRVLAPGRYVLAVRMAAWANPERVTVKVSRPFTVAAGRAT
jgi:hypothetical protein